MPCINLKAMYIIHKHAIVPIMCTHEVFLRYGELKRSRPAQPNVFFNTAAILDSLNGGLC